MAELDPNTDPFRPPDIPTEVHCLHCNREYESYLIEWRVLREHDGKHRGYWCCPTRDCDGKGFGFDIFPTDPDYLDADGEKMWNVDDDESDEEWEWEDGDDWSGSVNDGPTDRPRFDGNDLFGDDDLPW